MSNDETTIGGWTIKRVISSDTWTYDVSVDTIIAGTLLVRYVTRLWSFAHETMLDATAYARTCGHYHERKMQRGTREFATKRNLREAVLFWLGTWPQKASSVSHS